MATALIRTILLYLILMVGLRAMGKRQIGELEPIELVLTLLISDLASVPMQDFGIPLLNGVVPILTLLSLSMLLSWASMHSIRFRRLICGNPTTLIKDGILQQQAMRRNRFTLDELIEELRAQGVTDLKSVKYAVLETNGQLSVLLYPEFQPATPHQLGKAGDGGQWCFQLVGNICGKLLPQSVPLLPFGHVHPQKNCADNDLVGENRGGNQLPGASVFGEDLLTSLSAQGAFDSFRCGGIGECRSPFCFI